jgi:hypothetical protein
LESPSTGKKRAVLAQLTLRLFTSQQMFCFSVGLAPQSQLELSTEWLTKDQ